MKTFVCNITDAQNRYHDYRSVLDYIYSQFITVKCEYLALCPEKSRLFYICNERTAAWIRKLSIIGLFKDRTEINYDGFSDNCIGVFDGREVIIENALEDDKVYLFNTDSIDAIEDIEDAYVVKFDHTA